MCINDFTVHLPLTTYYKSLVIINYNQWQTMIAKSYNVNFTTSEAIYLNLEHNIAYI